MYVSYGPVSKTKSESAPLWSFRGNLLSGVLNDLLIHYVPNSCPAPQRIDFGELMAIKEMRVGQKGVHVVLWSTCMKMTAVIDLTQPARFILQME